MSTSRHQAAHGGPDKDGDLGDVGARGARGRGALIRVWAGQPLPRAARPPGRKRQQIVGGKWMRRLGLALLTALAAMAFLLAMVASGAPEASAAPKAVLGK